jgi:hypothetical protein
MFATESPLAVGQSQAGLSVVSSNLPAIASLVLVADAPIVGWPSDEDTPPEAYELADSVSIPQQGGLPVPSIAPTRPPSTLADPGPAIQLVLGDLDRACTLGWIGKPRDDDHRAHARPEREDERHEFCSELKEKLQHAQKALARGKRANAAHALQEFLHELSEKKDKRVNSNAYALLFTNVDYLVTKVLGVVPEKDD